MTKQNTFAPQAARRRSAALTPDKQRVKAADSRAKYIADRSQKEEARDEQDRKWEAEEVGGLRRQATEVASVASITSVCL